MKPQELLDQLEELVATLTAWHRSVKVSCLNADYEITSIHYDSVRDEIVIEVR